MVGAAVNRKSDFIHHPMFYDFYNKRDSQWDYNRDTTIGEAVLSKV